MKLEVEDNKHNSEITYYNEFENYKLLKLDSKLMHDKKNIEILVEPENGMKIILIL